MQLFWDFMNKNASALFGVLGTVLGFAGNYILQKLNRKHEITKKEAKEYFKEKRNVLTKAIRLIADYEFKMNTLYDFVEDNNGVPIRQLQIEDVFAKYFELIFEYLHSNRFYLEEQTIEKLDRLVDIYHLYKLDTKVIISEQDDSDIPNAILSRKQQLFSDAQVCFNELKEQVKFDEIRNFQAKIGQNQ